MNKFLLIFLIALVAATTVPATEDFELEGWWSDFWGKVKDFFKKIPTYFKKAVQWLKDNGFWDKLVEIIKKYGTPKAMELCVKLLKKEDICTDLVNFLFGFLK